MSVPEGRRTLGRTACAALCLLQLVGSALTRAQDTAAKEAKAGRQWSPDLLHFPKVWTDLMNDAIVSASKDGVRVEVAASRKWAVAAVPSIVLPVGPARIRVKVRQVGHGAKWFVGLYGDLRGTGAPRDTRPFYDVATPGVADFDVHPDLFRLERKPLIQVQLGLEGEPGAYAVFESLEFLTGSPRKSGRAVPGQRNIECVEFMPNIPKPFKMKDWRALAQTYDRFAFDFTAKGEFLPLIWWDESRTNFDRVTFGLPSYVGDPAAGGENHEGINCMGAILGATLAGIDKSKGEHNWVLDCQRYFNKDTAENLVLNRTRTGTGGSFWYEIWPHIVFYALADRYPGMGEMDAIMRTTADRWYDACSAMGGTDGTPDFDHTAFNFKTMKPVDNGQWKEPDAAAGIAWLEYMAWVKYRDPKYLQAADWCMIFLHVRRLNPYYENLMPWGALAAARMNAELERNYDVDKFIKWCFGISDCRGGWGVIVGNWGGYDCHGLLGSVDNRGGYAFAMNTFTQAGALVPLVRYDPRYARALGKWMLNLANAAHLFYPNELPEEHQSCFWWEGDPNGVVAYEGLRKEWEGKRPYGTGDPVVMKWGPKTNRGLYGSSYVGFLGGIVGQTNDEKILALDCLATDFFHDRAYPTYLYYNPYDAARKVTIDVGSQPCDLYDAATHRFLRRNVKGAAALAVPADNAVVVVVAPAGGRLARAGSKTLIDGVVVDYLEEAPWSR